MLEILYYTLHTVTSFLLTCHITALLAHRAPFPGCKDFISRLRSVQTDRLGYSLSSGHIWTKNPQGTVPRLRPCLRAGQIRANFHILSLKMCILIYTYIYTCSWRSPRLQSTRRKAAMEDWLAEDEELRAKRGWKVHLGSKGGPSTYPKKQHV